MSAISEPKFDETHECTCATSHPVEGIVELSGFVEPVDFVVVWGISGVADFVLLVVEFVDSKLLGFSNEVAGGLVLAAIRN